MNREDAKTPCTIFRSYGAGKGAEKEGLIRFAKDGWMNPFGMDEFLRNGWLDEIERGRGSDVTP